MATTPRPLVWDFYKNLGQQSNIGGTVHYFDKYAQTIYINEGALLTRAAYINEGQWKNVFLNILDEKIIENSVAFNQIAIDHPANGVLYLIGATNDKLYYMRYVYAMDVSNIVKSGNTKASNANEITQTNLNLNNIGAKTFDNSMTLFQPGARVQIGATMGDASLLPLTESRIDEAVYNVSSDTSTISSRNNVGYVLSESVFVEDKTFHGTPQIICAQIFDMVKEDIRYDNSAYGENELDLEVAAGTSLLEAIKETLSASGYNNLLVELPDGLIVVGHEEYISQTYQKNGYYNFDKGKEVFSRKTSRSADAAYSKICVTSEGLTPVVIDVNNYKAWTIPKNKVLFVEAPQGLSQEELQTFAEAEAKKVQYAGVKEQISGPFRPQLLVGDIAREFEYTEDGETTEATAIGIITEVSHSFGRQGFFTSFTTDSGGVVEEKPNGDIVVSNTDIGGYNRVQRMIDYMVNISKKITKAITRR